MSIPKCLEFSDYNKYPADDNPTTNAQMQQYMGNQNELVKQIANMVWQPQTSYVAGQIVHSDSMPAGFVAVVTNAGQSGTNEPTWKSSGTVTDGGVTWTMRNMFTDIDNRYTKATGVSISNAKITVNANGDTLALQSNTVDFGRGIKAYSSYDSEGGNSTLRLQSSNTCYIYINDYSDEGEHFKNISLSHTPVTCSNSDEIATTKFVKNQNYATQTDLSNKLDKNVVDDYIVETGTSTDGSIWYRKWNSGWLEQGGNATTPSNSPFRTIINFPSFFANDDYMVVCGQTSTGTSGDITNVRAMKINNQSMYVGSNIRNTNISWYTCGYGKDGE